MHLCRRVAIHKLLCPCRKVTSSNLNNISKIWQLWTSARGQWEHQPSIPEHPVTQCLLRLTRNHLSGLRCFSPVDIKGTRDTVLAVLPNISFHCPLLLLLCVEKTKQWSKCFIFQFTVRGTSTSTLHAIVVLSMILCSTATLARKKPVSLYA